MRSFEITIEKDIVSYIERCYAEYEMLKDNITFLIQNNADNASIINSTTFHMYEEKELHAKMAYDNARNELTERYMPKELTDHKVEWDLDFRTCKMHIRQLCDCEVAI